MKLYLLSLFLSFTAGVSETIETSSYIKNAFQMYNQNNFVKSRELLLKALTNDPENVEAIHFMGVVCLQQGVVDEGVNYLRLALDLNGWNDELIMANYVESLSRSEKAHTASDICKTYVGQLQMKSSALLNNCAAAERRLGNFEAVYKLLDAAVEIEPGRLLLWTEMADVMLNELKMFAQTEQIVLRALEHFPDVSILYFYLAHALQFQGRHDESIATFQRSIRLDPASKLGKIGLATVYQMLGKNVLAKEAYEMAMPFDANDASVRNNYGALIGNMGFKTDEIRLLKEALAIDPNMSYALVNLGGYYQNEGDLEAARHYLSRALVLENFDLTLQIRIHLLMPSVSASWAEMIRIRVENQRNIESFLLNLDVSAHKTPRNKLNLEHIHFYIVYHGVNDRKFQELVMTAYRRSIDNLEYVVPRLGEGEAAGRSLDQLHLVRKPNGRRSLTHSPPKVRVGFISKYFYLLEPHGMLLDGIMKMLPRDAFEVIALPVAASGVIPLSPFVRDAADRVLEISFMIDHATAMLQELELDILVFADTMSEPMTHLLAHSRFAPVQLAFWGNPVTSGSHQIDYFMSSEGMEHPFRTRMPVTDEPYVEQVVLLEGQGIWYYRPEPPSVTIARTGIDLPVAPDVNFTKQSFDLADRDFVYFCPQSVFKIHPLYDSVFREILSRSPHSHIVVTGGRRESWTTVYETRLVQSLGGAGSPLIARLHIVPRVSSEKFLALLNIADVILHPFPFDGSRTSADALIAGVPYVTLPTEFLKGRMGAAFLRTMNMPELVARNISEYIDISVRLSFDKEFYTETKRKVAERSSLIWEDMENPYEWTRFIGTLVGMPQLTFEEFLLKSGRNVQFELEQKRVRDSNRNEFDRKWGRESWLLESDGVARLEFDLNPDQMPRVFENWKYRDANSDVRITEEKKHSYDTKNNALELPTVDTQLAKVLVDFRSLALKGQFEDAFVFAEAHRKLYSDSVEFNLEFGVLQYFRGDYASARDHCARVVALEPENDVGHACVGVASIYLQQYSESLVALQNSLRLMRGPTSSRTVVKSQIFTITETALQFNLMTGYSAVSKRDCVDFGINVMDLPDLDRGGAYIALFSLLDWSSDRHGDILELESHLRATGRYVGPALLQRIKYVQQNYNHIQSPFVSCVTDVMDPRLRSAVLGSLSTIVAKSETSMETSFAIELARLMQISSSDEGVRSVYKNSGLTLVTQHFNSGDALALEVFSDALRENLVNPAITRVLLINEEQFDYSEFPYSWKITQLVLGSRLTFKSAIELIQTYSPESSIVVLANADVYFDESLWRLGNMTALVLDGQVLALSKWTRAAGPGEEASLELSLRTNSQDAWIFKPHSIAATSELDFFLGVPRCDNRLAYLLRRQGLVVSNPAFAIHAVEIATGGRQVLYGMKGSVLGDGSEVLMTDVHTFN